MSAGTSSEQVQPLTVAGHWDFHYSYFAGDAASRFFAELGNRRIMGTLCAQCQRTLVPARGFCDACFAETTEWREVGPAGRLEAFTILVSQFPGLPDPPVVIGYVTLDGASTALLNFVHGVPLDDLEAAGRQLLAQPRVEVRFCHQPQGRITDFHFEVTGEQT